MGRVLTGPASYSIQLYWRGARPISPELYTLTTSGVEGERPRRHRRPKSQNLALSFANGCLRASSDLIATPGPVPTSGNMNAAVLYHSESRTRPCALYGGSRQRAMGTVSPNPAANPKISRCIASYAPSHPRRVSSQQPPVPPGRTTGPPARKPLRGGRRRRSGRAPSCGRSSSR